MLATFIIEIALAFYTFFRFRLSKFAQLTTLMLVLFAVFQLSEYQICSNNYTLTWARVGFVAITLLPILGLHLINLVNNKTHFLKLGYILSILFIFSYLFAPNVITNANCGGNYIIFRVSTPVSWLYGFYYFGFLILAIWEIIEQLIELKLTNARSEKDLLYWIAVGYISFLFPMGIIYILSPSARAAVPSIMCGFAVIFALILTLRVVPLYHRNK